MGMLDLLISHLIGTKYENLPTDVVEVTRKQILDTLAATVGGSTCSVSGELAGLVDVVRDWGGKEESTIVAFGGRVPAPNAALVNGVLCVRLDFDDTQVTVMHIHPSRAIVPTAFAMAERQGDVTGKEFITAVALGHDLECRIREAVGRDVDSPFGTTTNFLGAAATAGKILGLDTEKLRHTMGLAFHQISGAMGGVGTAGAGASVKGLNNGFAVKAGIVAALLAEKGFASGTAFLEAESRNNFYQVFFNGMYWPWLLTLDLGKVFAGSKTSQKEFPCCHGQHAALKATLELCREHDIKPETVAEVLVRISPFDYALLGEPLEKKQNPQNIIETQFSLCWGVGSAIAYGDVGIRNFTGEALGDAKVREMVRKVFPRPDMEMAGGHGFTPAIVEIRTKDGILYSRQVDRPSGTPENPMSFGDAARKFRYCCRYSVKPISDENQNRVIEMVRGLEEVSDVGQIVRFLA
jgi:2-methylcitrate dehydratase PrpD